MAFVIQPDEALSDSMKRIVRELIDHSIAMLSDSKMDRDDAVHQTRKNIKKIRAVLRIIRKPLGRATYTHENIAYRDIARELAGVRDGYVKIKVFDKAVKRAGESPDGDDFVQIRQQLVAQYEQAKAAFWADETRIAHTIAALKAGRDRLNGWHLHGDDFTLLMDGLQRVYARGLEEMEAAYAGYPDAEKFHDWRKRVKYLWHHIELLTPLWPAMLSQLAEELHQLADALGDAHDFAVLHDETITHPSTQRGRGRALIARLDYFQAQHEGAAWSLGHRLYAEDGQQFVNRLEDYWQVWRCGQQAQHSPFTHPVGHPYNA